MTLEQCHSLGKSSTLNPMGVRNPFSQSTQVKYFFFFFGGNSANDNEGEFFFDFVVA